MGSTYTRQSTFTDGDTITADLFNTEFDQLVAAFAATSGHSHDGTAGEGGPIGGLITPGIRLGDNTIDVTLTFDGGSNDGILKWMEDEDYFEFSDDILIASTEKLQFRDTGIYLNSSVDGQLDIVADTEIQIAATTIDMNGNADISGNLGIGGNLTVTGTTTFNGGTITMGDAATDNVVFGANIDSNIIPDDDDTYDLGSSDQEWRNLYVDGVANIDSLVADTADINGGTIDGAVIGGSSAAAGSFTTVGTTGNITVGGTVDGRDVASDGTKLDAIEAGATPDQSNAEIRSAVEAATDSNVFTDADHTKLNSIEASATADQTNAEIRAAVEAATDSNVFTDADHTKLNSIEASADVTDTANVTAAGALMDSELTAIASVKALNQGVATGDSPTFVNITATSLDISGNIDVDGTTNLDVVDIDGAVDMASTLTVAGVLTGASLDISGDIDVDGTTNLDAVDIDGAVQLDATLTVGADDQGYDVILYGDTASANITWDSSADDLILNGGAGIIVPDGNLTLGSTAVTSTAAELNILDGKAFLDEDNLASNSATGIASQQSIKAYVDGISATNITATGALDSGSITSGFGSIDNGASAITTTGLISGGSLDIDNVLINGTTIGHTDDTDLITLADGIVTVAGEVSMTTLDLGGTNVTASAADINLIDGITNGTVIASKAIITDANIDITGGRNITISGELDAATLDISGNGDVAGTLAVSGGSTNGIVISQGALSLKNGGSKSYIDLYCEVSNAHYTRIEAAAHGAYSGNVTATLPVTTGTLALTSEIPTTEEIQDLVGGMVTGNTETNITVTYQDADGTLDFVVNAAQPDVTSLGTLTSLRVDDVVFDGATIGHADDTDLITVADGIVTVAGEMSATTLDIGGTNITSTAAEINILDGATVVVGELNSLDLGSTAIGTAIASKAVVLDANKDYTGVRNFSITGNLSVGGTTTVVDTVTMNAQNAVVFEGATADEHETILTIIDPTADRTINLPNQSGTLPLLAAASNTAITSTPEELNILDGVTSTATELNTLDGITAVVGELNALDIGSTAVGTAVASKAVILDANKDYTGVRNFTLSGELDAGSLDISGNADIDGTLEADAITIGGTSLAEVISDTVGAMVTSNTESGITVTYVDTDNTLDFTVATLNQNTTGSAATLTTARAIAVSGDVTGTANFNGSAGISISTTLATDAIVTANITNANVTVAKMAANSVDSAQYVDGSIDRVHLAADIIDGTKIANDAINSEHYAAGSIDNEHIADNAINSEHYADNSIDALHLNVSGNGSNTQFLRSDADGSFTWAVPTDTNTTYSVGAGGLTQQNFTTTLKDKLDGIAASATNTVTNATHSGEVTGSGALTVANDVIDAGNLKVTGNGSNTQFLRSDGDGTFTWATPVDTNTNTNTTNFNIQANGGTQVNISAGEEINFINGNATTAAVTNQTNPTVTFHHNDTSSQASVNNSGRTYIQDITLDGYGHITAITSATETVTNTNTTYSVGAGGLTQQNFTTTLKNKLDGIAASANNYSLPASPSFTNLYVSSYIYHSGDTNTYMQFTSDTWRVITGGTTRMVVDNSTTTMTNTLSMSGHTIDMNNNAITGVDALYHEGDSNTYIQFHEADQWRVVTGGTERLEVNNFAVTSTREIRGTANVVAYYSDERLKTRVGEIEYAVEKVKTLDAFYYVENDLAKSFGYDSDKKQVALSAQDVQKVLPEAVTLAPFDMEDDHETGETYSKSGENYLTVDYAKMVPLLIQAIKEQQQQIDTLKLEVAELRGK